jgi:hypothetical protein
MGGVEKSPFSLITLISGIVSANMLNVKNSKKYHKSFTDRRIAK